MRKTIILAALLIAATILAAPYVWEYIDTRRAAVAETAKIRTVNDSIVADFKREYGLDTLP